MNDPRELPREPAARQCGPLEIRMPADPDLVSAMRLAASAMAAWKRSSSPWLRDTTIVDTRR